MVFGQKRLKTNLFFFSSNHSENNSKHHFSACFTYRESLSQFEILTKIPRAQSMVFGQKPLKKKFFFFYFQSLRKQLQTSFLGSFYLYRKFQQISNFDQNPKGLVHGFWPKTAKNKFSFFLLQITLKTTPNIISRLLLPIQKVLANLKF